MLIAGVAWVEEREGEWDLIWIRFGNGDGAWLVVIGTRCWGGVDVG